MTNQTPGQDQQQINAVPWTNGRNLVTGATVSALLTAIVGTFYLYAPLASPTFTGIVTFPPGTVAKNGALPHVANLAELQSYPTSYGITAVRDGYAVAGDGGNATYTYSASACPLNGGIGDGGSQVQAASGGCWVIQAGATYSVLAWGADPTYATASDTAFSNWWNYCMAPIAGTITAGVGGKHCVMPSGHYKFAASAVWDFATNFQGGGLIEGAGMQSTTLDFSGTTGNNLTIQYSGGGGCSTLAPCGAFFGAFKNFSVFANDSSTCALQLGKQDFSDALNGFVFESVIGKNLAASTNSCGIEGNYIVQSSFTQINGNDGCVDPFGNCPSAGDGVRLWKVQFSTINASGFGAAQYGLHISGDSYGNTIDAPDFETVYNDVIIDSATAFNNNINNGTYVWCNSGAACAGGAGTGIAVIATAGYANNINNPVMNYSNTVTGAAVSMVGIKITYGVGSPFAGSVTPGFPLTNTAVQNLKANTQYVLVSALPNTAQVCSGPGAANCSTNGAAGGSMSVMLNPLDSIKVIYAAGSPAWQWTAAQ